MHCFRLYQWYFLNLSSSTTNTDSPLLTSSLYLLPSQNPFSLAPLLSFPIPEKRRHCVTHVVDNRHRALHSNSLASGDIPCLHAPFPPNLLNFLHGRRTLAFTILPYPTISLTRRLDLFLSANILIIFASSTISKVG